MAITDYRQHVLHATGLVYIGWKVASPPPSGLIGTNSKTPRNTSQGLLSSQSAESISESIARILISEAQTR